MTPLPVKSIVVVRIDAAGNPIAIASNLAPLPELNVQIVRSEAEFDEAAKGKPFKQVVE